MKKTENYTKTKETKKDETENIFGITEEEYKEAEIIEKEEGE